MKFLALITLMMSVITSLDSQARDNLAYIKGFQLKNCNAAKKCISLNSKEAESGSFTALMMLSDYKIEITEPLKVRVFEGKRGYYDSENKKIVLTMSNKSELAINLEDLSEQKFE